MKIGIMGTHGTGKTTLAKQLEEIYLKLDGPVALVTGVARSCPWPINQGASEEAQRWIFHRQMLSELEAMAAAENVICDRTSLDSLAYAYVGGMDQVVEDYLGAALDWLATYDQLFWLRPAPGRLVEDGQRDCDPAFQAAVDRTFKLWIDVCHIPVLMTRDQKGGGGDGGKWESSGEGVGDQGGADPGAEGHQVD